MIRNVVAEAVLADQLGLDFFGIGEHHRDDFAVSAPGCRALRDRRRRPGASASAPPSRCSALTIPVRVFQRFSTLDAMSDGRAEVILGRGSFIESFPLFGYALERYEQLFEEKLAALHASCARSCR